MATFAKLLKDLKSSGVRRRIAVPEGADESSIEALHEAREICAGRLFGRRDEILSLVRRLSVADDFFEIVDCPDEVSSCREALQAIRRGECHMLMKGQLPTSSFLKAVLHKEWGLRKGALLSHVMTAQWGKALIHITDGGMNVSPSVDELVEITRNALDVARDLGQESPSAALISCDAEPAEAVPAPETVAIEMSHRFLREAFPYAFEGALPMDDMFAHDSLPDVLVAPDIATGNLLAKSLIYFSGLPSAGLIAGAAAPVIMLSRADEPETKLNSIAVASTLAAKREAAR